MDTAKSRFGSRSGRMSKKGKGMNKERITAVILAGGEGRRLRPITESRPKPLVPIGGKPTLFHILELLARHGVREAVLTTAYRAEDIRAACGEEKNGIRLSYSHESVPLGTAGGVKVCEERLSDTFLVISGDCFTQIDLSRALAFHRQHHADATILLKEVDDPTRYGIVLTDAEGRVTRFEEKPAWNRVFSNRANTGIYLLQKSLLKLIPQGLPFDFSKDLFPLMVKMGLALYAVSDGADWCDIGDAGVLLQTNLEFERKRRERSESEGQSADTVCFGGEEDVSESEGQSTYTERFGIRRRPDNDTARFGREAEPLAVFGADCRVGEGSVVEDSLLFDGVSVGRNCVIEGAILCEHVTVGDGVRIGRGCIIGGDCVIGDGAVLPDRTKLARHTHLRHGEEEKTPSPFPLMLAAGDGFYGGEEELTLSVCRSLGRAMALSAGGGKCAVCAERGQEARKDAMLCGMEEVGGVCFDLGVGFDRLAAFAAIHLNSKLTACVGKSGEGTVRITLWDADGLYPLREAEQALFSHLSEGGGSPTEKGKRTKRAVFSDIGGLYAASLSRLLPETLPFTRFCLKGEGIHWLAEALVEKGAVLCSEEEAEVCITVDSRGEGLVFSQGGTAVDGWHAAAIIARSELEKGAKKIVLPFHSPLTLERIASERGGKAEYYSFRPRGEGERLLRASARSYLYVSDASHAAAKLLAVLAGEGCTLREEESAIPPFAREEEELLFPDGGTRSRLLTRLAEEKNASCSDGILLDYGKSGQVHLKPDARSIGLFADSYDSEQAAELMALSKKTIERLLRKKP